VRPIPFGPDWANPAAVVGECGAEIGVPSDVGRLLSIETSFLVFVPTRTGWQITGRPNAVGAADLIYYFMTGVTDGHSRSFALAVRLVKSAR
jgi:hypothetical protein